MLKKSQQNLTCQICQLEKERAELIAASSINPSVTKTIVEAFPKWSRDGYICLTDLNHFRTDHIRHLLSDEKGELNELEAEVARSLTEQELLSHNVNSEFDSKLTVGEHIADQVATFGGSWKFIILFGSVIFVWIVTNAFLLVRKPFDPFPFILLNLVLSCLAALQAPVIMMSQNRQESKDRLRSEHDYKVNLKAELEIRHLNEKLDHLINQQWQNLLETQQIQLEMLEELMDKSERMDKSQKEDQKS